jgi:hypothetical protein
MATERRRKRPDKSDQPLNEFLPERNRAARWSYVAVMVGLVPLIGLVAGAVAVGFGIAGWVAYRRQPAVQGGGHSLVGIILGSIECLCNALALICWSWWWNR